MSVYYWIVSVFLCLTRSLFCWPVVTSFCGESHFCLQTVHPSGFVDMSHLIHPCFPEPSICPSVSVSVFFGSLKAPGALCVPCPDTVPTLVLLGHSGIVLHGPLCVTLVQGEAAGGSSSTSLLGINT